MISAIPWDSTQLSIKLKEHPELIDDFFGREWVRAFCGQEQANKLGIRLDANQIIEFRRELAAFYRSVFNTHDPGLPGLSIATAVRWDSLSLEDRFVIPDVYVQRSATLPQPPSAADDQVPDNETGSYASESSNIESSQDLDIPRRFKITYRQRQSVDSWLASSPRSIILGSPGGGKSTLLRFVAIDLLQESSRLALLAKKWGTFLPVWVPFAWWTHLVADPSTSHSSLSDMLQKWLASLDENRLWPLVKQALEDERLLLLVDGLDEWANEDAARVALDRLQVFISQRGVPAILASRSHGFERLGIPRTEWQLGELSDFTPGQQNQLARIWFSHRLRSDYRDSDFAEEEVRRRSAAQAERFCDEVSKSEDLGELAKIPLLLSMLISLRLHSAQRLPRNRFRAYDALVQLLLSEHPRKRKAAASLVETQSEYLDESEIQQVLGHLAFVIQEEFSEGLIDLESAGAFVATYLQDAEQGFGLDRLDARRYSRWLVEIGQSTIGLLVRKSQREIGFFHRVFQEYLAARYLSGMTLAKQLAIVEEHCADPQWREVILALFYLTARAEDIKQFVDCIRGKELSSADHYTADLILAETAFGEFNCSAGLARELASDVFAKIELGSWLPHRERLLLYTLDGLRSTKVKELVKAKLRQWSICRSYHRDGVFGAMAKWSPDPEVIECLWRNIHDENTQNQRAAARALANLTNGDPEIGDRLADLARYAVDPDVRAAALETLLHSWPEHHSLEDIIEAARLSSNPNLRLVAILGRIQFGRQTEQDRQETLRLGSWEIGADYYWRDQVVTALVNGWPRSPETKQACFGSCQSTRRESHYNIRRELALPVLLEGYSQDEDVAELCAKQIRSNQFPFAPSSRFEAWQLLSQHFRGHRQLVAVIDEWLPKQRHLDAPETALAASVALTTASKSKLLSFLTSGAAQWPAGVLIEHWGLEDEEVAARLTEVALGPAAEASRIAHLLPQIIQDGAQCRARLLELLQNPECERPDFVMSGLKELGGTEDDTEVVSVALKRVAGSSATMDREVIHNLIMDYPSDDRVEELARQEMLDREGFFEAVAWGYGDREEFRQQILDVSAPLPSSLRLVIAEHLGEGLGDDDFALSLLGLYDYEKVGAVKTQLSMSYHARLKAVGRAPDQAAKYLSEAIHGGGFDHVARRQAAFCGLLTLNHLDIFTDVGEQVGNEILFYLSDQVSFGRNSPLVRSLVLNWPRVKTVLGAEFWKQDPPIMFDAVRFWDAVCPLADEYPLLRDELLTLLADAENRSIAPNILRFIGRVRPKSNLLLDYCLQGIRTQAGLESVIVAAELLGTQFGGDENVLERIASANVDELAYDSGVIIALCEGWAESEILEQILLRIREQERRVPYPVFFQLASRKSPSQFLFDAIIEQLPLYERFRWEVPYMIRPIVRRLRVDSDLLNMLIERLQNEPSSSAKATVPQLISQAQGLSPELRDWCSDEIDRQLGGTMSPEVGFDWIAGDLRPVAHSLLDVLSQSSLRQ